MRSHIFDRMSFWSLFLVIALLPIFFLPFTNIPVETSKGFLLVAGLACCVVFWCLARFFDGKASVPRSMCLLAGGGVVLTFLISAIFSKSLQVSFFGTILDVGTFWFIFAGFLLMLMSSIIFRDSKSAKIVLFGVIVSSFIALAFQSVHLFIPKFLSLGGLVIAKTDNIVGSWNTFGIFAGLSSLAALLVIEFFSITKLERLILQILIILSLLLVAVVNFSIAWELLGIFSLIIFVYKVSIISNENPKEKINENGGDRKMHFPTFSFIIVVIALLFFMSGQFIGGILSNRLQLQNSEVSPSFYTTISITKSALKQSPVFGMGPNNFSEAWAMYKPAIINNTDFWDVSFNHGSGLLPTFAVTTGSLGILAWLIFLILFICSGMKSMFISIKHGTNWETMAFFSLSLYLFTASFFYSTGPVLFLLALAFAGVFIGVSSSNHQGKEISILFLNDHKRRFFSILFLVLIIIASLVALFKFTERIISVSYFEKTVNASTLSVAENYINEALSLYSNDLYLRTYSEVYLIKLNSLVANGISNLSDADKALLQTTLNQAVSGAQAAVSYDSKNYLNFQNLGSIYQSVASFGVTDAYSKALGAYQTASNLNPKNPGLQVDMASVSMASGDLGDAKTYANNALALKSDDTDALVILSQIEESEGDAAGALSYAEAALSIAPTDQNLINYVNSLKNSTPTATSPATSNKSKE